MCLHSVLWIECFTGHTLRDVRVHVKRDIDTRPARRYQPLMAVPNTISPQPPQIPEGLQKKRGQKSRGLQQAQAIQDFTFEALMALRGGLLRKQDGKLKRVGKDTAKAITDLCRANDAAQDRIRIHRGIPLPGSMKQVQQKPRRRSPGQPTPQPVVSCGVKPGEPIPLPTAATATMQSKPAPTLDTALVSP